MRFKIALIAARAVYIIDPPGLKGVIIPCGAFLQFCPDLRMFAALDMR
jgi:hypothetical protein